MTGQRSGSKCCLQMDQFIFSYKVCLNSTMHPSLTFITTLSPSLAIDLGEHSVDYTLCTVYKPLSWGHVKYSCFAGADFLACLFICLFLLYPISTIKPFTTLLQFTFLKYLFKSIIVCWGQLLCSIIYHLLLTQWKLLPRMCLQSNIVRLNPFVTIWIVSLYYAL